MRFTVTIGRTVSSLEFSLLLFLIIDRGPEICTQKCNGHIVMTMGVRMRLGEDVRKRRGALYAHYALCVRLKDVEL